MDVGCGTGVAAVEMAELMGASGLIHAIDPSSAMVACTAERAGSRRVEASVGDARAIQPSDSSCGGARTERPDVVARAATKAGATDAEVEAVLAELHRSDQAGDLFAAMTFYVAAGILEPRP